MKGVEEGVMNLGTDSFLLNTLEVVSLFVFITNKCT